MDKSVQLGLVIDGIINGDDSAIKTAFAPYIEAKSKEILGYGKAAQPVQENIVLAKLREDFMGLDSTNPIKLQGDRVIVDNKEVGVLQSDPTDFDSGINFIETGGRFSKEFDTVEALYDFLTTKYTKHRHNQ